MNLKAFTHIAIGLSGCILLGESCTSDTAYNVKEAMQLAGENREELELVLNHYSDDPEKLEAAKFLIANMPGHYSYSKPEVLSRYHATVDSFASRSQHLPFNIICDSVSQIFRDHGVGKVQKVYDCTIMRADYLIENIDDAFNRWRSSPWLSHLSAEEFYEYVLPYKVMELQPLDSWRTDFKDSYRELLDELRYCDLYDSSAYRACKTLNDAYKRDLHPGTDNSGNLHVKDIAVRMKIPHGTCSDFVNVSTAVFRSVGLPIAQDCTPHWANIRLGHSWNVLLAQNGKNIPFVGMMDRMENGQIIDERPPKVFRRTYASNDELKKLNLSGEYVPPFFRDIFRKDVTAEYISTSDVVIDCKDIDYSYAFLCVFGDNDWTPVHFAKVKNGKAKFDFMARNVVYLPVVYTYDGRLKSICDPFRLNHDGSKTHFSPTQETLDVKLYRKSPALRYTWDYAKLAKGGEFEASNSPDFSGKIYRLHTIPSGFAVSGEATVSDSVPPCRFWRYIHRGNETYCSMADISFYSDTLAMKPLRGKTIGSEGSWENDPQWSRENLFDNDPLTSYCAPVHTGCWVGLDMGQPVKVSKLRYTPRGDGNMIEPGDIYELLVWDNGAWKSLGRKEARTVYLEYRVPVNSILLLRDITKGHEERIFIIDDNGNRQWG